MLMIVLLRLCRQRAASFTAALFIAMAEGLSASRPHALNITQGAGFLHGSISGSCTGWYGKEERRSLAGFRLDPDAPTMALDNFLAQGQANASTRVAVPRVQTLKDDKNPLSVLWCYADAV